MCVLFGLWHYSATTIKFDIDSPEEELTGDI